jgi:hypothetical protein
MDIFTRVVNATIKRIIEASNNDDLEDYDDAVAQLSKVRYKSGLGHWGFIDGRVQ